MQKLRLPGPFKLLRSILPVFIIPILFASCGKEATTNERQIVETNEVIGAKPQPPANKARPIEFPRDEGAHYEQPIEWWYLNAQLSDASGKQYAFFITVLSTGRHLVSLYDKAANKVHTKDYYERVDAAQNSQSITSLSLKWKQDNAPFRYSLAYDFEGMAVQLAIKANKKPFLPGGNGFISMGENGTSHYYALTDLTVSGSIGISGTPVAVNGTGWFDHQWGKWDWVKDFSQWKWYGVKLDNGVDLMLFNLYKDRKLVASHCGYMDANGDQFHNLTNNFVTREYYTDPSGGKWQKVVDIKFPSLTNTLITLTSENDLQFIETNVLWEGSMKATGTFNGAPVKGTAYGELNRPD